MSKPKLIVVALGGNAISRENEEGNVDQQFGHSRDTSKQLADLVDGGWRLVITHGNGPQIGNFLLRNMAAAHKIYPLPMEVATAHVQGGMGFMIAQTMTNELNKRGHDISVSAVVTTVLVDRDDPAFENPTKPVGRVFDRETVEPYIQTHGWTVKEVSPGKFRRVVPSPQPLEIMEIDLIRRAVQAGELLVACGGGGIPVIRDPDVGLGGVRAVIDKDLASAHLAQQLDADVLLILTVVERVSIDFGKPTERAIERMTVEQARKLLSQGQFPEGSMGPKIQGAIEFLESSNKPGARVIIGPLDRAADAISGKTGTCITA